MIYPIATTVERALAGYLQRADLNGRTLAEFSARFKGDESTSVPLSVHNIAGRIDEDGNSPADWDQLTLPVITVYATAANREPATPWWVVDLLLTALTSPSEIDAPVQTQARIGWLEALFDEENLEGIITDINTANAGVALIGITIDGSQPEQNGRHVSNALRLKVWASPAASS